MRATGKSLVLTLVLLTATAARGAAPTKAEPDTPVKRVTIGPGVVLEIDGSKRRGIVASSVVLRKGVLEGLLTRAKKKEHEYILAADVDARHIHTALELAKAKAGGTVRFQPKFAPASGTSIKISLRYEKNRKTVTVPVKDWLKPGKG